MLAAENDALPGGKVGGIGDVVRDVPSALAKKNCHVTVISPAYHSLARVPGAEQLHTVSANFRGEKITAEVYRVPGKASQPDLEHWVLDHPLFSPYAPGQIYCDDGANRPFATDASKFALFCALAGELVMARKLGDVDILHLHDWHAATLLVLRQFDPNFAPLRTIKTVYTIHNLALQGVRPVEGDDSSLRAWFPSLRYDPRILDPRWKDCINLMRAGILLADKVHTVSPSYAEEIVKPSAVEERGYFGGEGLEVDLQLRHNEGNLIGILNGCEYPEQRYPALKKGRLSKLMKAELLRWVGAQTNTAAAHFIANQRIEDYANRRGQMLLTSVGRVTDQKVRLLAYQDASGQSTLDRLLALLGDTGTFLCVGSGDSDFEQFLVQASARHENFVFLKGYSEKVANALYASGHLFLMPSSFEPCGISQMLAMRAGQPCLVHSVGGLKDTVQHRENGFAFSGNSVAEQAQGLLDTLQSAIDTYREDPASWKSIVETAAQTRFTWADSVEQYLEALYA